MMTFRTKVVALGGLNLVLIAGLIVGAIFSVQTRGLADVKQPLLPSLHANAVTSFTIRDPKGKGSVQSVALSQAADGKWWVSAGSSEYPADKSKVENFLKDVADLQTTRTVTTDKALYKNFSLDDPEAKTLTMNIGKGREIALYYGKDALGGGYVRLGNDPSVYLVDKSLTYYLNRSAQSWYYLRLFPETLSNIDIQSVDVKFLPGMTSDEQGLVKPPSKPDSALPASVRTKGYRLVRQATSSNANTWFYEGDLALSLDQPQVESVVREIIDLQGTDFAAPSVTGSDAGVDSPGIRIAVETGEGKAYSLSIGHSAGKNTFYVIASGPGTQADRNGKPYIYVVSRYYLERALKPVSDLRAQ